MDERNYNAPFKSSRLNALRSGAISLGVPTLNNVIQIRADQVDGRARLVVEKTKSEVSLTREDGAPLQVDLNARDYECTWKLDEEGRAHPVFVTPVTELVVSFDRASDHWIPGGEGVESIHSHSMMEFVDVVAQYALKKQSQHSRLRVARASLSDIFE